MKYKLIFILCMSLSGLNKVDAQNVLSGVYPRYYIVRNNDTLESVIKGKVISKGSSKPLQNIVVEYMSSVGQHHIVKTDQFGNFKFWGMVPDSISGKVVCFDPNFKTLTWEFNTHGISQPWEFNIYFELETK